MNDAKYIGLDVHQATISAAVLDWTGKLVMECVLETKATTILQLIHGLRGSLHVTLEEGTCAAWLHDLLKPHVTEVLVCNPRKNALLKVGNKNDRIDARKLAELLRSGLLSPVYHGENGVRTLKELARSYLTVTKDLSQVMNRLKAVYRSWAIACAGKLVYTPRHRAEWLQKLPEAGVRRRAERLYQQLDVLRSLRQGARQELLAESRKHPAARLLRQIPCIGPIRAALLIALIQTPHRFRTKRQLWAYSGLALATRTSAEYRFLDGQLQRSKKLLATRGLNANHNHDLKNIFKGTATLASVTAGPFQDFYTALLAKGMKPSMARLTLARKIAAITLIVWKKGVGFDAEYLKQQAA
ncbi:MAG: transposase [Acidobacteriia bacterium]|nr:transposase [Terriglobia bacterium]